MQIYINMCHFTLDMNNLKERSYLTQEYFNMENHDF